MTHWTRNIRHNYTTPHASCLYVIQSTLLWCWEEAPFWGWVLQGWAWAPSVQGKEGTLPTTPTGSDFILGSLGSLFTQILASQRSIWALQFVMLTQCNLQNPWTLYSSVSCSNEFQKLLHHFLILFPENQLREERLSGCIEIGKKN